MDVLSDDLLLDVAATLPLCSLVQFTAVCYELNQRLARVLNIYTPSGERWWREKLLSFREENSPPTGLLPNEEYVLLSTRVPASIEFALQAQKEAMIALINSTANVSFGLVIERETEVLTPLETVYLLKNKQYGVIWRAARISKRFPVRELMNAEGNLSLLEGMFEDEGMNNNMISLLIYSVVHDATAPGDILRKLAAHPCSRGTLIFEHCMTFSGKKSNACEMVLNGVLLDAGLGEDERGLLLDDYLRKAVASRREDLVQRLLLEGADPNDPVVPNGLRPLNDAISYRDEALVRMLVASPLFVKGRVNQDDIRRTRGTLNKLVHELIKEGKIEVVR